MHPASIAINCNFRCNSESFINRLTYLITFFALLLAVHHEYIQLFLENLVRAFQLQRQDALAKEGGYQFEVSRSSGSCRIGPFELNRVRLFAENTMTPRHRCVRKQKTTIHICIVMYRIPPRKLTVALQQTACHNFR